MALHATQYNYHGLKQADVRKIWVNLFKDYRDLGGVHFFSKIDTVGSGASAVIEVTCTGSLLASRRPVASGSRSTAGTKKCII